MTTGLTREDGKHGDLLEKSGGRSISSTLALTLAASHGLRRPTMKHRSVALLPSHYDLQ
jgi:hypothetical protein